MDGHVKFWKKKEDEGIEFVKHFRSHLGRYWYLIISRYLHHLWFKPCPYFLIESVTGIKVLLGDSGVIEVLGWYFYLCVARRSLRKTVFLLSRNYWGYSSQWEWRTLLHSIRRQNSKSVRYHKLWWENYRSSKWQKALSDYVSESVYLLLRLNIFNF